MAGLKPETLQLWGREAQDLEISSERAAAIAKTIDSLAATARAEAHSISFDAEPADFLRALERWRGSSK